MADAGQCLTAAENVSESKKQVVERKTGVWKQSEVIKNKKFRLLLLLEAILLFVGAAAAFAGDRTAADESTMEIALHAGEYLGEAQGYYIDAGYDCDGVFLTAKPGRLRPGVYLLRIVAEAGEHAEAVLEMENESGIFRNLLSDPVTLSGGAGEQTGRFYVRGTEDSAKITVNYGGAGSLLIRKIELVRTGVGGRVLICLTLAGAAFANTLVMLYCYMKKYPVPWHKKLVWFGIPGIAILASVPLFVDYMIIGEDAAFYSGTFPAFSELLWLIGFDMTTAYNTYVFAVNLATALIAYLCFRGCFRDSRVGMLGSLLYTLAPYRIYQIYNRGAVGEYTAMAFLPLLAYGFYRIFTDDTDQKKYRWSWLFPVLGFSGLLQSDAVSFGITVFFAVLLCLVFIKKALRRQTLFVLAKTVLLTIVLNLRRLLPGFDRMVSGGGAFLPDGGNMIRNRGLLPANIFYTMQAAGSSSRFDETGLLEAAPIGVGMAVLLGTGAFWIVRGVSRDKRGRGEDRAAVTAFLMSVFALAASTVYFPWDAIQSWNKVTAMLVSMLEFPWRLTIVPAVCMVFVACAGAAMVLKSEDRFWKNTFFIILCGTAVLFSLYQTNDILVKKEGILRLYNACICFQGGIGR